MALAGFGKLKAALAAVPLKRQAMISLVAGRPFMWLCGLELALLRLCGPVALGARIGVPSFRRIPQDRHRQIMMCFVDLYHKPSRSTLISALRPRTRALATSGAAEGRRI